jgi:hypothetical protein
MLGSTTQMPGAFFSAMLIELAEFLNVQKKCEVDVDA